MLPTTLFSSASTLYSMFLLLPPALAHMEMQWPYPLRSKFNPGTPEALKDYSMTSPLDTSGANFPCKGYHDDATGDATATYSPGSTYNMTLAGTATHGGGSCQLSLSYDNGETFKVIKSMMGGSPLQSTYNFTIPLAAPAGAALFAWSWQNKEGNREFYMNCARVNIAASPVRRQRQAPAAFGSLPNIWVANLKSKNTCTTTEGEEPVYPNPGHDVQYGGSVTSSSPVSPGNCDNSRVEADPLAQQQYGASQAPPVTSDAAPSTISAFEMPLPWTTTVTVDCPDTITLTIYPTATHPPSPPPPVYTTSVASAACTGTAATCPCAVGYDCRSIGTCTWACVAQGLTSSSGFVTLTASSPSKPPTVVATVTSAPPPPPPSATNNDNPGYATDDVNAYLPCVPGTFICSSPSTFYTCNYNDGSVLSKGRQEWVYDYPRQVAAGMMCEPHLSRNGGGDEQQANTLQGYHRDDQYVRAR